MGYASPSGRSPSIRSNAPRCLLQTGSRHESRPDIPKDPKYAEALGDAIKAVLKGSGSDGSTYSNDEKRDFFWYRYLFLGRGKPSTHLIALSEIKSKDLRAGVPPVLKRLVEKMKASLEEEEDTEDD